MSDSRGCEADYSADKYVLSFLNLTVHSYETKELYLHSFRREGYVEQSSVKICLGSSLFSIQL